MRAVLLRKHTSVDYEGDGSEEESVTSAFLERLRELYAAKPAWESVRRHVVVEVLNLY